MTKFSSAATLLVVTTGVCLRGSAENKGARVPVLLELFTSEGCSSCPPADRLLETLDRTQPVGGAELIVLSEHVDYWDGLGWKDPFSSPQYSARQYGYASKFHLGTVYTPQLVVDGRVQLFGGAVREAIAAIENERREQKIAVVVSHSVRNGNQVTAHIEVPAQQAQIDAGAAVLYVALAENKTQTQVARGEN